jgi:hypothetical protein
MPKTKQLTSSHVFDYAFSVLVANLYQVAGFSMKTIMPSLDAPVYGIRFSFDTMRSVYLMSPVSDAHRASEAAGATLAEQIRPEVLFNDPSGIYFIPFAQAQQRHHWTLLVKQATSAGEQLLMLDPKNTQKSKRYDLNGISKHFGFGIHAEFTGLQGDFDSTHCGLYTVEILRRTILHALSNNQYVSQVWRSPANLTALKNEFENLSANNSFVADRQKFILDFGAILALRGQAPLQIPGSRDVDFYDEESLLAGIETFEIDSTSVNRDSSPNQYMEFSAHDRTGRQRFLEALNTFMTDLPQDGCCIGLFANHKERAAKLILAERLLKAAEKHQAIVLTEPEKKLLKSKEYAELFSVYPTHMNALVAIDVERSLLSSVARSEQ